MSFSFNTPTTNTAAPIANFCFGTPKQATTIAAVAPTFGSPTAATTPAFGATTTPAFGAATTPAFGAATTPAFGAATTSAFGASANTAAVSAFGATSVAAPSAFGMPAATVVPAFGMPAATAVPVFGVPTSSTLATTPALSFGSGIGGLTAPPATNAPTFNFAAPAAVMPLFGTTTASTATATVTPTLSFGSGSSISGGLATSLPATALPTIAPPAFSYSASVATSSAAVPTLGLGSGVGSFSFAKPATTTAAALNFGTTTTTVTATPFNTGLAGGGIAIGSGGGGIFGKSLQANIGGGTSLVAPTQATTTAPTAFVGLGGIDVSTTQPKPGDAKLDTIKVKETQVPDEIAKTVEALKQYIKEQKTIASDIGRTSTTKFTNISGEITNLQWSLQEISNSVESNHQQIKLLRAETSKAIQSVEMAQRTQDTPSGLQFENHTPFQYFQCLVVRYEQDLIAFRQQIMLTERHMHALANPQNISPEELKRGFKQINEAFIAIAGRLHEIHQKVEEQKELYLNLRRYRLRDATNVFEELDNSSAHSRADPLRITSGPTPFSNLSVINTLGKSYNVSGTGAASNVSATQTGAK